MKTHKTVFGPGEDGVTIEKSRFIGYALPVGTEEEATKFIEKIKKKHWDATHNVPVYVIGEDMATQRYSDDGEPSGTAGVPVLEMLKKEGITNVCIVMTRYYGGTKLGTGGLVRAYTQTAKCALDAAVVVTKKVFIQLICLVDYHFHGKIQNYTLGLSEVILDQTEYGEQVRMTLYVDPDSFEGVCNELIEITSNQIELVRENDVFLTIKNGGVYNGNGNSN